MRNRKAGAAGAAGAETASPEASAPNLSEARPKKCCSPGCCGKALVVAVSLDSEAEVIAPYLASMGLESSPVVVWRDPEGEANKIFGGEKLPDTYFINQDGEYTDAFINVRVWGSTVAVQCVESRAGQTG